MTSGGAAGGGSYVVVLRCRSGARVRPGHGVLLRDLPTDSGPISVIIRTRYENVGLESVVPRELFFEVRCLAMSLDAAVSLASAPVSGLAAVLAFVTNAAIESPRVHVAYDAEPGVEQRDFLEMFLPDETGLARPGRWVDEDAFIQVVTGLGAASEHSRLARAISQYEAALRHWNADAQVMVLSHLYMAAEALTNAVERKARADLGISAEEHARRLGVDTGQSNWKMTLLAFARRQYVFGGDKELYDRARKASDAFEHGSGDLSGVRAAAAAASRQVFSAVRAAIVDLVPLPDKTRTSLQEKHPVDVTAFRKEMRGRLVGAVSDPDALAAEGEAYPLLRWEASMSHLMYEDDQLKVSFDDKFTVHTADGVSFEPGSYALSGGLNPPEAFGQVEAPTWSAATETSQGSGSK